METQALINNQTGLIALFIYAASILFYNHFFMKEVGSLKNLLSFSIVEQIKIVFLAIVGIVPFVNTIMCFGICIYYLKKHQESKINKYE